MLEEIQMAPNPLHGVVRLAWLSANRAGKERSPLEVDPNVQPPLAQVEIQRRHLPWGLKSECRLEKLVRVHPSIGTGTEPWFTDYPHFLAKSLKLLLQDFFEQPNRRAGATFLNDWCTLARASGIPPLMRVAATFQQHRRGILNWWRSQISNGLIEGINSLIQAAIAKARGYRNPQNLISIAYLIAGKLDLNNPLASRTLPT